MSELLTLARRYHALGFSVIPIRPPCGNGQRDDGKLPALAAWREYQTRLATDDELVAWFSREPLNLAIVTGAISGIVVVDADNLDALRYCTRRLPYTPWQTQTGHGFHLYYRYPSVRVGNTARLKTDGGRLAIDVRGDGGYVIAPGSHHASGVVYRTAGDWTAPRAQVPVFWAGWLARPPRPPTPTPRAPRPSGELVARARAYLAAIPAPVIGQGSDAACFTVACRLVRGFELSSADAGALLWEWCGGRPGWTREWVEQKVAHAERYGAEPMGGLR
jgi:hypothetical protein